MTSSLPERSAAGRVTTKTGLAANAAAGHPGLRSGQVIVARPTSSGRFLLAAAVATTFALGACVTVVLVVVMRLTQPEPQTAGRFVVPYAPPAISQQGPQPWYSPPETPTGLLASLASLGIIATESDLVPPPGKRNPYFHAAWLDVLDATTTPVRYRWVPMQALELTTLHGLFGIVATRAANELSASAITYEGQRALVAAQDDRNPLITYHLFACTRQLHSIVVRSRARRNLTLYPLRHEGCEADDGR